MSISRLSLHRQLFSDTAILSDTSQKSDSRGRTRSTIHVDHIIEKATGRSEALGNSCALCPNCHEQKTHGVITVDLDAKQVRRFDRGY